MTALENVNKKEWTALSKCEGQFYKRSGEKEEEEQMEERDRSESISSDPLYAIVCVERTSQARKPVSRPVFYCRYVSD